MGNRGRRILLTGGAGLIGSHMVDRLIKEGEPDHGGEIIVLDNFVRGRRENLEWALANGPVTVVDGDVRDRKLLADVLRDVDWVFHLAALRITHSAEEPRLALEVMVNATFNLLEEAVEAEVKKIVASSSASVYGMAENFPTQESHHPYGNRTLYGAAKTFNEGLLRTFYEMYGLDYVALRYFNVYGPRMDIHGAYTEVMVRWMEQIRAGRPPVIFGDGTQTMDFVYVEDIARANILAAKQQVTDEVFNVGSGKETTLDDLASALLKVMGSDLQVEYAVERKVNPVSRRLADVSKACKLLGFQAQVPLEIGLERLVVWWKEERFKEEGRPS